MADLYYAKWHIRIGETTIRPGEAFECDADDEDLQRLLKKGAVEKCGEPLPEELTEAEEAGMGESPAEPEAAPAQLPAGDFDVMDGIVARPKRSRKNGAERKDRS